MGTALPTLIHKVAGKRIYKLSFVLALTLSLSIAVKAQNGSVGIGTFGPDGPLPNAVLEISSDDKGLLIPRLDVPKALALKDKLLQVADPKIYNGMLIYAIDASNDVQSLLVWKNDNWAEVGGGTPGQNGQDGKSAYEIWLSTGNTGDPQAFLESLKGDVGESGATWYAETDPATIANPKEGDLNLDKASGDVYRFDGTWSYVTNLKNGAKGDKGEDGEKGDAGQSAYQLWEAQVANIGKTEVEFLESLKGQSAYQLWKTVPGNELKTDVDFLNSLKGEKGAKGDKGDKGDAGQSAYELWVSDPANAGKTPADFLASVKGEKGDKGDAGAKGDTGDKGDKGDKGDTGQSAYELWVSDPINAGKTPADFLASVKGEKGDKGDAGAKGDKGDKGDSGLAGSKWYTGVTAPTGASPAAAVDGDMYFDSSTNKIWEKQAGAWVDTGNSINPTNAWSLDGNSGTTPATTKADPIQSFIGTTDNIDFVIGTFGQEAIRIKTGGGNVGIGTSNPGAKLDVQGTVVIGVDGSTLNKVLRAPFSNKLVPAMAAGASAKITFSSSAISGASITGTAMVSPLTELPDGIIISYSRVSAAGVVEAKLYNASSVAYAGGTFNFTVVVIQ